MIILINKNKLLFCTIQLFKRAHNELLPLCLLTTWRYAVPFESFISFLSTNKRNKETIIY